DREAVAQESAKRSQPRRLGKPSPGQQDRQKPLAQVKDQCRARQPLAAGAQHVGRANMTRTEAAQSTRAECPGQQQTERYRAQGIAQQQCKHPIHVMSLASDLPPVEGGCFFLPPERYGNFPQGGGSAKPLEQSIDSSSPLLLFDSGVGG